MALARGDGPLILLSYDTICNRTAREILARLRLDGALGISTPIMKRHLRMSEIPTQLFPDLLVAGQANPRRFPPFYLFHVAPSEQENPHEVQLWVHISNPQGIEINPFLAKIDKGVVGKELVQLVSGQLTAIDHVPHALTVCGKEVDSVDCNLPGPLTLVCTLTPHGMEACEKRVDAVKEFVESERLFVMDVSVVLGFWRQQLKAERVIEEEEGIGMFRSLEAVACAHALFLEKLDQQKNSYSATIGGVFCDTAQMFKASAEYFSNARYIQARLMEKMESPDVARRVAKISEMKDDPRSLIDLLNIPLTRYDYYEEFLSLLKSLTPECHTDFRLIGFAMEIVQQVNVGLKMKMMSDKGMMKCIEIQKRVKTFPVLAPARDFVCEFDIQCNSKNGHLYLFTDLMLVTTEPSKAEKVKASYAIADVRYMAKDNEVYFRNYKQKECCQVDFASPDDAQRVLTHILQLKMDYYENVGEADKVVIFTPLQVSWELPSITRHTGAVVNDMMYFFGGKNEEGMSDKFITIDRNWHTSINVSPFDTTECAAAVVGEYIYIFGGVNAQGNYNSLYKFHVRDQEWQPVNAMDQPAPRKGHTMVSYDRKLYIFGGIEAGSDRPSNTMLVFNTETETWSDIETDNRPEGRHRHSACVWSHYMIVHGGTYGRTVLADIRLFDFTNNEWLYPHMTGWMLFPRYAHSTVMINNWLVIVGGTDGWHLAPSVAIYCTDNLEFTIHPLVSGGNNSEYLINSCMLANNSIGVVMYGGSDMHGTTCSTFCRLVMPPLFCEYEYATGELDYMTQGHMNLYYPSADDPDYLERMKRLRSHGVKSCSSLTSGTRGYIPEFPACRVTPEDASTVACLLTPLIHSPDDTPTAVSPATNPTRVDVPIGIFVPPELHSKDLIFGLSSPMINISSGRPSLPSIGDRNYPPRLVSTDLFNDPPPDFDLPPSLHTSDIGNNMMFSGPSLSSISLFTPDSIDTPGESEFD